MAADPVLGIDERPQPGIPVHIQIVPDEHDRGAELLVGGDQQVAVLGPGETASAAPFMVDMPLGPEDQARAFALLVAGQSGDREPALGTSPHPD